MAPVTPQDFLDNVPSPNDALCERIKKSLIDGPTDFYELVNWMFNSDGTISTAFAEAVCLKLQEINCAELSPTTTSTTT